MKRKNTKGLFLILILMLLFITSFGVVQGWMFKIFKRDVDFETSIRLSYFESGNGDEFMTNDDRLTGPYEIAHPVQLYYFAWLQDIGYFNNKKDESGNIIPTYFYLSDNLNMSGWVLPSIGTREYPFVGSFDGTNHVISNLVIDNNNAELTDSISEIEGFDISGPDAQIVGFFGVVGEYNGAHSTNSEKIQVVNFGLDNVTVKSSTPTLNKTLIGIVGGYINAPIGNIFVSDSCSLSLGSETNPQLDPLSSITESFSNYTLIGYITEKYRETLNSSTNPRDESLYDPARGSGWGGSIDMLSLYNRLVNTRSVTTNDVTVQSTNVYYNGSDTPNSTGGTSSSIGFFSTDKSVSGQYIQAYYANNYSGNYASNFNYLYGYDQFYNETRIDFTITPSTEEQFKITITNNTAYNLYFNGTTFSYNNRNSTNFQLSSEGYLYTIYNDKVYYVNASNTTDDSTLTVGQDYLASHGITKWERFNGLLRIQDTNSYLGFNGTNPRIRTSVQNASTIGTSGGFSILSNNYYMNATNALSYSQTNNTTWYYDEDSHDIYSFFQGTREFLVRDGLGVSVSTIRNTDWTKTDNSIYTTIGSYTFYLSYLNDAYYLVLNEPNRTQVDSAFYYVHDGYYMNYTGSGIGTGTDGTSRDNATVWLLDNSNHLYTNYNGTTYYLNNNGVNLTVQNSGTTEWNFEYNHLYVTINTTKYYLVYSGSWKLTQVSNVALPNMTFTSATWYTIMNTNASRYFNLTGDSSFGSSANNGTFWYAPTSSTQTSLYTTYNGRVYYARGNTLSITTTANSNWRRNNNYLTYNGTTRYLRYYNNTFSIANNESNESRRAMTITGVTVNSIQSGNTYLNLSSSNAITSTTSVTNGQTRWVVPDSSESSSIYTNFNGNAYYLNVSNGNLTIQANSANPSVWTRSSTGALTTTYNGTLYYLNLNGTTWRVTAVEGSPLSLIQNQDSKDEINDAYKLSLDNTNYLTTNNTSLGSTLNQSAASIFRVSNNQYFTGFNGNQYFISLGQNDLSITDNPSSNSIIHFSSSYSLSFSSINTSTFDGQLVQRVETKINAYEEDCYFPIIVEEDEFDSLTDKDGDNKPTITVGGNTWSLYPHEKNTGYVISGGRQDSVSDGFWILRSAGEALTFSFTGTTTSGKIYCNYQGRNYYLTITNGVIAYTTVQNDACNWSYPSSGASAYIQCKSGEGNGKYLYINRGKPTISDSRTSWARTTNGQLHNGDNYLTFGIDSTDGFGYGYTNAAGNIRVSLYEKTKLNSSLNDNTYWDSTVVYTNDPTTKNVLGYNSNKTNYTTISDTNGFKLTGYTAKKLSDVGFEIPKRYSDARDKLNTLLLQSNVYGLHFMDASISMGNLMTASKVQINSIDYSNYQMPRNSIDFILQEQGNIVLFAGSYFSGNDCLFSLHQIYRDIASDNSESSITKIKEIQYVYTFSIYLGENTITNIFYYYKPDGIDDNGSVGTYSFHYDIDGNYNPDKYYDMNGEEFSEQITILYKHLINGEDLNILIENIDTTGLSQQEIVAKKESFREQLDLMLESPDTYFVLKFNTDWLTNPQNFVQEALYYFEIPAAKGEYALGSVSGKTGAYLLYLDIAAYGEAESDNSKEFTTDLKLYEVPSGVQLVKDSSIDQFEVLTSKPSNWDTSYAQYYKRSGNSYVLNNSSLWDENETYYMEVTRDLFYESLFVLLENEPDDWAQKYSSYFTREGEGLSTNPYKYVANTSSTFSLNKYYKIKDINLEESIVASINSEMYVYPKGTQPPNFQELYDTYYIRTGGGYAHNPYIYTRNTDSTFNVEAVYVAFTGGFSGTISIKNVKEEGSRVEYNIVVSKTISVNEGDLEEEEILSTMGLDYELLTEMPDDWNSNYSSYYVYVGEGTEEDPFRYVLNESSIWVQDTYYLKGYYYKTVNNITALYPETGKITIEDGTNKYNLSTSSKEVVNVTRAVARDEEIPAQSLIQREVAIEDFGNHDATIVYDEENNKTDSFSKLIRDKAKDGSYKSVISIGYSFNSESEPTINFYVRYYPYNKYVVVVRVLSNMNNVSITLLEDFSEYDVTLIYFDSTENVEKEIAVVEATTINIKGTELKENLNS